MKSLGVIALVFNICVLAALSKFVLFSNDTPVAVAVPEAPSAEVATKVPKITVVGLYLCLRDNDCKQPVRLVDTGDDLLKTIMYQKKDLEILYFVSTKTGRFGISLSNGDGVNEITIEDSKLAGVPDKVQYYVTNKSVREFSPGNPVWDKAFESTRRMYLSAMGIADQVIIPDRFKPETRTLERDATDPLSEKKPLPEV